MNNTRKSGKILLCLLTDCVSTLHKPLREMKIFAIDYSKGMIIDLPQPGLDNPATSYTELTPTGRKRIYRGFLYQLWCHFVAHKA